MAYYRLFILRDVGQAQAKSSARRLLLLVPHGQGRQDQGHEGAWSLLHGGCRRCLPWPPLHFKKPSRADRPKPLAKGSLNARWSTVSADTARRGERGETVRTDS